MEAWDSRICSKHNNFNANFRTKLMSTGLAKAVTPQSSSSSSLLAKQPFLSHSFP
jgi:hypothetical protein